MEGTVRGMGGQHERNHWHHDGNRTGNHQEYRLRPKAPSGHHTGRHSGQHVNNVGVAHGHLQVRLT